MQVFARTERHMVVTLSVGGASFEFNLCAQLSICGARGARDKRAVVHYATEPGGHGGTTLEVRRATRVTRVRANARIFKD